MSSAAPGDQFLGILAEADEQIRRHLVAAEHPDRLPPRLAVLRQRHGRLAGHPAAADVVVERLDVDADGVGARVAQLGQDRQVGGRLALHLDGQPGHRGLDRPHAPGQMPRAAVGSRRGAGGHHHLRDAVEPHRGLGDLGQLGGPLDRGGGARRAATPRWSRTGTAGRRRTGCTSERRWWPARFGRAAGRSSRRARPRRSADRRTWAGRSPRRRDRSPHRRAARGCRRRRTGSAGFSGMAAARPSITR